MATYAMSAGNGDFGRLGHGGGGRGPHALGLSSESLRRMVLPAVRRRVDVVAFLIRCRRTSSIATRARTRPARPLRL
jgi:hypothetical protein